MNISRVARPYLLSAVLAAMTGSGQASILVSEVSDAVRQADARHFGVVQAAPTLEGLLEPFNFQDADAATALVRRTEMEGQLTGRGLAWTGRRFADAQQIDTWYSAAEDRSVVCVAGAENGRSHQTVYVMAGRVRRADVMPLP